MNLEKSNRLFILVIAAGLLLVCTTVFLQGQSIMKMEKSLATIANHIEGIEYAPAPIIDADMDQAKVLMQIETTLGLSRLVFTHECVGQVIYRDAIRDTDGMYPPAYCKGVNVLRVTRDNELPVELLRKSSSKPTDAPLLQRVEVVGSASESDEVLISYKPNPCKVDEDACGVGLPGNYVSHLMNDDLKIVRALNNYPANGTAVWGNEFAAFIKPTCGGAGCDAEPIVGYDPHTDRMGFLTQDAAASEANARNADGAKLAYWKSLKYLHPQNLFEAVYVSPTGEEVVRRFQGTF